MPLPDPQYKMLLTSIENPLTVEMESETLRLYAEVATLKARLASALQEKEDAEQSLLYVIGLFTRSVSPPHLTPTSTTEASVQPTQSSFNTATEDSSDREVKPECSKVDTPITTPKIEDLLDEPPKLELTIRGTKTTHDVEMEPLVPLRHPFTHDRRDSRHRVHHYQEEPAHSYFMYGIRYKPPHNVGTFHRVIITGLPFGIQMYSLLNQVRGGMIVSCQILDTFKLIGCFSALIRFVHETEALGFANHTLSNPMVLGGRKVTAELIKTPSYPLPDELHRNILNRYTRCLKVEGFTHNPMRRLQEICQIKVVIESCRLTPGATALIVHFSSVQQASEVYRSFKNTHELASAKFSFLADPCAQPF